DALEETTGEAVRAMMEPWILQGGYPVVEATPTPHGLRVRQRHFTLDPGEADARLWVVPLRIRTTTGVTGVVLDGPEMTLTGLTDPVVTVNADASGFFRVVPDGAAVDLVVAGHA
ncbi:MAG: hypothetical protein GWN79_28670, partial [Actinobacteria bacterium]|nr:hypothetical protein [Actinomycetota bacterium]NIS37249.1 hypothetical protein [Actinomycetota bacterium]NIT99164.1 hypothetical protein [Actinomycetota bacterium]NIU22770.1 hypothetical protein [Actinomycetota bacterium]NIU71685.1 hypothetical protein [Actinomycetota bacterium]